MPGTLASSTFVKFRELLETSGANSSFACKYRLGESKKVGHRHCDVLTKMMIEKYVYVDVD